MQEEECFKFAFAFPAKPSWRLSFPVKYGMSLFLTMITCQTNTQKCPSISWDIESTRVMGFTSAWGRLGTSVPEDLTAHRICILDLLVPGFSQDLSQLGTDGRGSESQAVFKICLLCRFLSKSRVLKEYLVCLWGPTSQKLFRAILISRRDKQTLLIHSVAVLHKSFTRNILGTSHKWQQVQQGESLDANI